MSKGNSELFQGTSGSIACQFPKQDTKHVNGTDFNNAGSKSVGKVNTITTTNDLHTIPAHSTPYSVSKNYKDGKLESERYYDQNGDAYLDIDYTNHGNSKTHPHVPHEHSIHFDQNGNLYRDDEPEGGLKK